jgi:hypothetical protein
MLILGTLIMDKAPSAVPASRSGDAVWAAIGLGLFLLLAIVFGVVSASKKRDRGGYRSDEDR